MKTITNAEAWHLYQKYADAWKPISEEQRLGISTEVIDADVQYATPQHASGGRDTMIEDMQAFQKQFPGGRFDVGDVSAHHDMALLTWILVNADNEIVVRGHDQIRVSPENKIVSVITFAPSVSEP